MNNRTTPTSKRSPSILVTDSRSARQGSAPFVRKFKDVSVDSVLQGTSEVPSAQARRNPGARIPPRQSQSIPSRTSKKSQRFVLIPEEQEESDRAKAEHEHAVKQLAKQDLPSTVGLTEAEQLPRDARADQYPRCTSYLLAEGFRLKPTAEYLRVNHRARTRLYDEALFVDYLLPLQPGDSFQARVQSSLGDNRTMERMIDISEQGDHHYEYFSGLDTHKPQTTADDEFDPSEPQDFSPRGAPNGFKNHPDAPNDSRPEQTPEARIAKYLTHAAMFVFNYGVVVFWNFSESQEKQIISDLMVSSRNLAVRPSNDTDIETEELQFTYTDRQNMRPRIFNDMITLTTNNHMIKLAMSHAIAQSTKLSSFEERMQGKMRDVKSVPKTLALTGKLGLKREQVLRISGALFKLRVDVNLSSNVLDTPDIFWESEPSLAPLYQGIRQYLEIDQRILVLNEKCGVFLELTDVLANTVAEFNMDRITVIIIYLIVLSIFVSLTEIAIRFVILRGLNKH